MEITPLTVQDPRHAAARDLFGEAHRRDHPGGSPLCSVYFDHRVTENPSDEYEENFVATDAGRVVGLGWLTHPLRENRGKALCGIVVDPTMRRHGIGSALLEHLTARSRAAGRVEQLANARQAGADTQHVDSAGRDFLLANGFETVYTGRERRLDLTLDVGEQALLDESWAHAGDYELVRWTGPTPPRWESAAAALYSRLFTDVPFGDLNYEETRLDADRYREAEAYEIRGGRDFVCVYARHRDSGEFVAHSVVAIPASTPEYAGQWITLVHPEHRGHRLGMIVKIENHRQLRRQRPAVRWIYTSNAENNPHMVAINEKLGFTEVERHMTMRRALT